MAVHVDDQTPANAQWLTALPESGASNQFLLGNRIVVQLKNVADLHALTNKTGLSLSKKISSHLFILQASNAWEAARQAHRLAGFSNVTASYPIFKRHGGLYGPYAYQPTDTNFNLQWPLEHRNSSAVSGGIDLNVRAAWPFTLGGGTIVAVADTGIEMAHPELSSNVLNAPHFNFVLQDTNAGPIGISGDDAHGTEVAGIIAAELNNYRMTGVAPQATLASWVIWDTNLNLAPDDELMQMYEYASNTVAVQNHSWGTSDDFPGQDGPTLLESIGISNAATFGRHGLGSVFVRAAGNGRLNGNNADDDLYAGDPQAIAVAAVRLDGRVASYSNPGACVLVGAPSGDAPSFNGLFTTDLLGTDGVLTQEYQFSTLDPDLENYVFDQFGFDGTSASAPHISGVAALILSANPNLGYRDVQQILIFSSRHFDFADPDLTTNGAGFWVSHNDGFGVPDAGVAVTLARHWTNRPPLTNITVTVSNAQTIPSSGLRVLISNLGLPPQLMSIVAFPDLGPHPDNPTAALPLADLGMVTNPIAVNLAGEGALIERGGAPFSNKIAWAAQAGAAFAVIYNYPPATGDPTSGTNLLIMGTTDFVPIPAVFIGNTDGQNLENLVDTDPVAVAQLALNSATYSLQVTNTLLCEHVGLTVIASNQIRGNLRITLLSPQGTRSVLQRYNADPTPGPTDWTYYSTHHFYESSAGTWTAYITD